MTTFDAVGDPSLSEAIGRRLLTPGGSVAPGVAPELFPVVVLENDRPEMAVLAGGGLYGRRVTVATPSAGNRALGILVNYTPDTLVVVERVTAEVASGTAILYPHYFGPASAPAGGGTTVTGRSRDTRQLSSAGVVRESAAYVNTNNSLPAPGGLTAQYSSTTTTLDLTTPIVLGPYGAVYVVASSDAVAINNLSFLWRERRINPSER